MKTFRLLTAILPIILITNCAVDSSEPKEYELNYENCRAMAENPDHPYRQEPIAVQGCETILFEHTDADK